MVLLQHLAHAQRQAVAEVMVTAPPVALHTLLLPRLAPFYAQVPGVRLCLQSSTDISNLHQRQADIALRLLRPQAPDLAARRLCHLHFGFYANRGYLQRTQRRHWQFLTFSTQNPLSHWAQTQISDQPVALACNDFALIKQAVCAGLGIGFLPADNVQPSEDLLPVAVHATRSEVCTKTLYLVMHEDVRRSPKVRAVADFLVATLADNDGA